MVGVATIAAAAPGSEPVGRWLTDGGNGAIEIYRCSERLCGRIVWLRHAAGIDGRPVADRRNPSAALASRPVCGLQVLGNFERIIAGEWGGGWIYSPEEGKTYNATLSFDGGATLKLRGFVGSPLFGRTQSWSRAGSALGTCAGVADSHR